MAAQSHGSHSHDHDHDHGHAHHHPHDHSHEHAAHKSQVLSQSRVACCTHHESNSEKSIVFALVGGAMVFVTILARWTGRYDDTVAQIPAAVGAILLWFPLAAAAIKEMQRMRLSSSFLAALAILAAFAISEYVTAGLLAFILFMMDAILRRTAWGAHKAIEALVQLTPDRARVVNGDVETEVPLERVVVGDVIRVRPGENLPADGVVKSGRTSMNMASLTGESAPVEVQAGDTVYAGTTNLTGGIDIEVNRVGAQTAIGKVVTLINEAEASRTPRQQIIEMVSGYYAWIVLAITFAVWLLSEKNPGDTNAISATEKAISVLVVTCPGALLLSSPTAMVAAFASAARLGIMIKSTETLESAAKIDTVVLDKTGTLTTGKFAVSRLVPAEGADGATLLTAAATAEQHSNHPLAKAIVETARAARITPEQTGQAEERHGLGVVVHSAGGDLLAGRASWIKEMRPQAAGAVAAVEGRIDGVTAVHVVKGNAYLGAVGLEDKVRLHASDVVRNLRDLGVRRVSMFTGDREAVAQRVGAQVGVDEVKAECHPEEKHAEIVALTQRGHRVMMVGDGINDGPSLAAADVGVAMGLGGTDIAANSAGVALMNDDLSRLPFLVELARRTRAVIAQNTIAALLIAVVGLAVTASGELGQYAIVIAALYHFVGDVFVIGNSFRLVRFGEDFGTGGATTPAHDAGTVRAPAGAGRLKPMTAG